MPSNPTPDDIGANGHSRPPRRRHRPKLAEVVERNIATLIAVRRQMEQSKSPQDRLADAITAFSGSMGFVYLHVAWFGAWIAFNLGWLGSTPFDPYPFGLLTMVVSLEAIFLSTFVLLSQNRQAEAADQRADLDLQINLLAEYEVTRLLTLVDAIADQLGIPAGDDPETDELKKVISPEVLLEEMQARHRKQARSARG